MAGGGKGPAEETDESSSQWKGKGLMEGMEGADERQGKMQGYMGEVVAIPEAQRPLENRRRNITDINEGMRTLRTKARAVLSWCCQKPVHPASSPPPSSVPSVHTWFANLDSGIVGQRSGPTHGPHPHVVNPYIAIQYETELPTVRRSKSGGVSCGTAAAAAAVVTGSGRGRLCRHDRHIGTVVPEVEDPVGWPRAPAPPPPHPPGGYPQRSECPRTW
ncbi:hypothetical protein Vafri_2188 [Volvox africanus]|nr:hypothetical protein Vafri_2188 [Volvox africanus]